MDWEVFFQFRKEAKRLQHDPDPNVRANALHIEEDARMVGSFESEAERMEEWDDNAIERETRQNKKAWRRNR